MRGLGAEDAAALRRTGEDGDPGAIRTRVRSQIEDLTVFDLLLLAASSSSAAPPQLLLRSWLLRTAALRRTGEDGDPGAIRTRDPQLRRLVLYPAELPGHDRRVVRRCSGMVGRSGLEPPTSAV